MLLLKKNKNIIFRFNGRCLPPSPSIRIKKRPNYSPNFMVKVSLTFGWNLFLFYQPQKDYTVSQRRDLKVDGCQSTLSDALKQLLLLYFYQFYNFFGRRNSSINWTYYNNSFYVMQYGNVQMLNRMNSA